jgi:hypothetical protein
MQFILPPGHVLGGLFLLSCDEFDLVSCDQPKHDARLNVGMKNIDETKIKR